MRILFCSTTYGLFRDRLGALAQALLDEGHRILTLYHVPTDDVSKPLVNSVCCNWPSFDMKLIRKFSPSLVLIWNGHFPHMYAATCWLRSKYRVGIMEMGWYPQKCNSYLADNLAQISSISEQPYAAGVASTSKNQEILNKARSSYEVTLPSDITLPERFVFVPMQLEQDTQITMTSHTFKNMDAVLGYVKMKIPELPIVFTKHPLRTEAAHGEGICDLIDMTGKSSSLSLALKSDVVIGVNSTLLAETVLFGKETIALGEHVAKKEIFRPILGKGTLWKPTDAGNLADRYDYRALVLLYNQWNYQNPPGWLIDKINKLDLTPRIPQK